MNVQFSAKEGPHPLHEFGPGLHGYYYRVKPGLVTIPVIISQDEGKGKVSEFLDSLPMDERIEFRAVMNPILAKALRKRGFRRTNIPIPDMADVDTDAYVRNSKKSKTRGRAR